MQHFSVWNFNKKRRMITILVLAFCTALFFTFKPVQLYQVFVKTKETALTKGNKNENAIALTFNISWGEEKVLDILNVLKETNTRSTFFISGEWAEKHPQIIEKIQEDKHEIGMLGYRYESYLDIEMEQVQKDILYAKEVFKKLDLNEISYIRPPNGHFNKEIIELAESMDLEVIHWSINPNDWENPGVDQLKQTLLKKTSNGDIVLLHASDSAKQTAELLKEVIPELQKKDLTFSTISELSHGINMKEKLIE